MTDNSPESSHERTQRSYDAVANAYAIRFRDELAHKPLDRGLIAAVIEGRDERLPVADIGCGPGHVAAWMGRFGVQAVGIDLSERMIEVAHSEYPKTEFRQGDFLTLPAESGEFGAAIAFYSIIHLEPSELPRAFLEVRRILSPSGLLLASFHIGSEVRHMDEWLGKAVDIDFRFFETCEVVDSLEAAGFTVEMQLERMPYPDEVETRRAYVMARAPRQEASS